MSRDRGPSYGWQTISAVAEETIRPRGTVATILRQFRRQGYVKTTQRSGRPLKTLRGEHWLLVKLVKEGRRASAKAISQKMR